MKLRAAKKIRKKGMRIPRAKKARAAKSSSEPQDNTLRETTGKSLANDTSKTGPPSDYGGSVRDDLAVQYANEHEAVAPEQAFLPWARDQLISESGMDAGQGTDTGDQGYW